MLVHQPARLLSLTEGDRTERSGATSREPAFEVQRKYAAARWLCDQNFGRIVVGNSPLSVRFSLIDPHAEEMAWLDAANRLGN